MSLGFFRDLHLWLLSLSLFISLSLHKPLNRPQTRSRIRCPLSLVFVRFFFDVPTKTSGISSLPPSSPSRRFSLERRLNGGQRLRKLGRRTSMVGRNACTNSARSEKQLLLSGNARCMAFRRPWYDCVRCSFITNENETRTKE